MGDYLVVSGLLLPYELTLHVVFVLYGSIDSLAVFRRQTGSMVLESRCGPLSKPSKFN